MFKNLMKNIAGNKPTISNTLTNKQIAELLNTSPEALAAFESAYAKAELNAESSDNFFELSAKDAKSQNKALPASEDINDMIQRIIKELLDDTRMYTYENGKAEATVLALPNPVIPVTNEDIKTLPEELRPELTGRLMKVDIPEESHKALLSQYKRWMETGNKQFYHMFRQGLDILDLDSITYEIIGTNPNSMGNWLPQLVQANQNKNFFKIPNTKILKVPMTLLQLTRQDYMSLTPTTKAILNEYVFKAFDLDETKDYFIKTGTYSSKFDFRNTHVSESSEIHEIGEYLMFIHFQALQMASPLSSPSIYGVSTTNEWVVRDFIPDVEDNTCIYHGMPLHTEYRIFIDCDRDIIIGAENYWKPEVMMKRFSEQRNMADQHDAITYMANMEKLTARYKENVKTVCDHIRELLPDLNLKGQWSIDVMQNGDDFWLIDMAIAESSAYYECVSEDLRLPITENWLPQIPETK